MKKQITKKLEHRAQVINFARAYPAFKLLIFVIAFAITALIAVKHLDFKNATQCIVALVFIGLPLGNAFKNALTFIYCFFKVGSHKKNIDTSKYVCMVSGIPGMGKSSSTLFDAICMAYKMWRELRFKHWLNMGFKNKILKSGDKDKIKEYYDIEEAYNYWKTHPAIPCFMSNTAVKARGKFAVKLTIEFLKQNKKIPYGTVLFFDEVGAELGNDKSHKKEEFVTVGLFFRWVRHFGEFHIWTCEQDGINFIKDGRRVAALNRYMIKQEAMLKPTILRFIFNMLKSIFLFFNSRKQAKIFAKFMLTFGKFINACGYRYYKCRTTEADGNLEAKATTKGKKRNFILPAPLNCEYDDRACRNKYKAKDMPLDLTIFKSLVETADNEIENAA